MKAVARQKGCCIILWGAQTVSFAELLSRELHKSLRFKADFLLQIGLDARTIDYVSSRVSEFLRFSSGDFLSLKKELVRASDAVLILDFWRLLFSKNFDELLSGFFSALELAKRAIVICPSRGAEHGQFAHAAEIGRRVNLIFESLINFGLFNKVTAVTSGPTIELFCSLIGSEKLMPAKVLGMRAAPASVRKGPAKFATNGRLVAGVCKLLLSQENQLDSLALPIISDLPLGLEEPGRMNDCSWQRYVSYHQGLHKMKGDRSDFEMANAFMADAAVCEALYGMASFFGDCKIDALGSICSSANLEDLFSQRT